MKEEASMGRTDRMPRTGARALFALLLPALGGFARCGGATTPVSSTSTDAGGEELVFQDEFDGPAGQLPDAAKWSFDVGGSGWGNQQLEYDSDRAENASLDGAGHLAITAIAESYQGHSYTSARIKTLGLFAHEHGRFEARIKMPTGQGLWPAFWMLGSDFGQVGWPACGEIDVMEYKGQEPSIIHGSLHGPGYSGGAAKTQSYALAGGARFDEDWHVFSIEWSSGRIAFLVDGATYQTVTSDQVPSGEWVFEQPFFIILDLAVGGDYVGSPNSSTRFPQTLLVDYVHVWAAGP